MFTEKEYIWIYISHSQDGDLTMEWVGCSSNLFVKQKEAYREAQRKQESEQAINPSFKG